MALNRYEVEEACAKLFPGKPVRWVIAYGEQFPGWWIVSIQGDVRTHIIGPDGIEGSPE